MGKILVTGGAGFIGSHVVDELIKNGKEVIVLDDLSGGTLENINSEARFIKGSVEDTELVEKLFKENDIEYVFHLAAYAAEGLSHFIRRFNYKNNLIGSINLINESIKKKVKCFVFTSSIAVYGKNQLPMTEETTPMPEDPYGISKLAVEQDLKVANMLFGLNYIIFRPHNCYDKETEILTSTGFKLIKKTTKKDFLATLDPKTNTIEYHQPTAVQKIKFNGNLYHFKSKSYNLMVTPEHKIWCKKTPKSKYSFIEAENLVKSKTAYSARLSCFADNWVGEDRRFYLIPQEKDSLNRSMLNQHQKGWEKIIPMEKWIEFLGWYISEGSTFKTSQNYVIVISQYSSCNNNNFNRIINLIKELGFKPYYTKAKREIRIFSKQLYLTLDKLFVKGAKNKNIPYEFKQLSHKYLKILYKTLMNGDGDAKGHRYTTKSKQLADDFCELLLKIGKSGTVSYDENCYRISITERNAPQLGDNRTKKLHVVSVPYNGFVYDVTVPNHIIFVRRKGKGCWSSNCYGERQNLNDKYRNVLGIFINQIKRNKPLTIYGDGKQTRAFSHIADSSHIIAKSIEIKEAYNQVFNIGADKPYTVNYLADVVRKAMNKPNYEIIHLNARKEVMHAHSTHEKAKKILGFEDKTPLEEGVKKMVEWAKDIEVREGKKFDNIEITENLPESWR